ncbi:MAG: HypC/HybG/HupF family hydrogenase formation chaperone [Selenomonadaceae bacterium]|nr:HypC/HybG/HupF family hydrogenase formation chaperone [Selenomonadaceae bacterium]
MCLAFPAKITEIKNSFLATVEHSGIKRETSLMLLPEAKVGDYVLVHAGFAMQIVDEEEVKIRDALIAEMNGAERTVHEINKI